MAAPASALASDARASVHAKLELATNEREASLRRLGKAKYFDLRHPKFRTYDILAATAAEGCGPPAWAAYMTGFPTMREGRSAQEPLEMFGLPPLVRYLYQFGACLSAEQKQALLSGLTGEPQWVLGHGTLNQAAMQATSWYLLAQYFPGARWPSKDGRTYTSKQLMAAIRLNLQARHRRFFESGSYEWLAPTYAGTNMFPMLNLYDFSADSDLRQLASDEATLELAVMRAQSFHGRLVPPLTRKNGGQDYDRDDRKTYSPAMSQHVLWLYFGEPANLPADEFESRRDPYFAVMFALSKWQPPLALSLMDPAKLGSYAIHTVTPSFSIWGQPSQPEVFGDSWITPDFALGTGNAVFEPGTGYGGHVQTFGIALLKNPPNQIDCMQPFFDSDSGEDAWGPDRWSPFQQTYRYDDSSAVMLFNIPKADPWAHYPTHPYEGERATHRDALLRMFECRIPSDVDEIVTEPQWVFVRQSNVFVAIATLKGTNEYSDKPRKLTSRFTVFKVREPDSALFFRVEQARPGYGFGQFRKAVRARLPSFDDKQSIVKFTENSGVHTQVQFHLTPEPGAKRFRSIPLVLHDGVPFALDRGAPIEAPFISLRNGVLRLNVAGERLDIQSSPAH